eukprot:1189164-Prorocentrum_minimum.AAC.2
MIRVEATEQSGSDGEVRRSGGPGCSTTHAPRGFPAFAWDTAEYRVRMQHGDKYMRLDVGGERKHIQMCELPDTCENSLPLTGCWGHAQFVDMRTLEQVSQVCRSWNHVAKCAKQSWLAELGIKLPFDKTGT